MKRERVKCDNHSVMDIVHRKYVLIHFSEVKDRSADAVVIGIECRQCLLDGRVCKKRSYNH